MNLIRTFHPIGQGAFYSERHTFDKKEFTLVYDCGSVTLKGKKLERKIKSTFPKNHNIDVLFISHFHADHINGIEILKDQCKINKVVIPYLSNESKILYKITNLLENNYYDSRLIDNPGDFFGNNTSIITIEETDTQGESITDSNNGIVFSAINKSGSYNSGTVFNANVKNDWFFIPFNYNHNERKNQFENALSQIKLKIADLDTIEKILKNKPDIIKAYKNVDGDLNENTMILFSGKNSDNPVECFKHHQHICYLQDLKKSIQSGCLYLGDINLNQNNLIQDIGNKLRIFIPYIGSIQVPHHGSIHNFNDKILQKDSCCAIISYGSNNNYGHPSDCVISDIIAHNIHPHLITEDQNSIVVQWN